MTLKFHVYVNVHCFCEDSTKGPPPPPPWTLGVCCDAEAERLQQL